MKQVFILYLLLTLSLEVFTQEKFKLDDFAIPLEQIVSEGSHIWVNSGYTTVNPEYHTVMGVNEFYSPPFAAKNFNLGINISIDSILITDRDIYAQRAGGLLYNGGTWYPNKIVREGTFHSLGNGKLISIAVTSELIPLFGESGFIEKISIKNRSPFPFHVKMSPVIHAGIPTEDSLEDWGFSPPRKNSLDAKLVSKNIWANELTKIGLYQEDSEVVILPGEISRTYFGVLINSTRNKLPQNIDFRDKEKVSKEAWERRLVNYTKNVPILKSNNADLNNYYKRSIISGLVCIWENPSYALNPFCRQEALMGSYLRLFVGYRRLCATNGNTYVRFCNYRYRKKNGQY